MNITYSFPNVSPTGTMNLSLTTTDPLAVTSTTPLLLGNLNLQSANMIVQDANAVMIMRVDAHGNITYKENPTIEELKLCIGYILKG